MQQKGEKHYLNQLTKKMQRQEEAWTEKLNNSCLHEDEQTFMAEYEKLFNNGVVESRPVQVEVLQYLVEQLKSGYNHKFSERMKTIAWLPKAPGMS